jgi:hypothetical protein
MEWLIAGAFGLVGLITAIVILIGQKNPKLKPYIPGIVRYPGAFGLGHPTDQKSKDEGRKPK